MNKPEPPNDLWKQLDAYRPTITTARPANSVTAREWADRYGCSMSIAYKELTLAVKEGKMERVGSRFYVLKK